MSFLGNMVLDLPSVSSSDNPGYLEASAMRHKIQRVRSKVGAPVDRTGSGPLRNIWGIEFYSLCKKYQRVFWRARPRLCFPVQRWCMKSRVQDDVLKVLGHHSRPIRRLPSVTDVMQWPPRCVSELRRAIFFPDSSRSGQCACRVRRSERKPKPRDKYGSRRTSPSAVKG